MPETPIETALRVAERFEVLGVRYFIGGSVASMVFGESRVTYDVDIVVDARTIGVERLVTAFEVDFHVDAELVRVAVRERRSFCMLNRSSATKIDVYVVEPTGFTGSELDRRRVIRMGRSADAEAFVASPEDIVLQKLRWYRAGGEVSERQLRDVDGVLKSRGTSLDVGYMRKWAAELGVADLLQSALDRTGHHGKPNS